MIGEAVVIADAPGRRARLKPEALSRRAVSTGGERLGAIVGAEVDEISFLVGALELSRGLWDDLRAGRTRVEALLRGRGERRGHRARFGARTG